MCAVDTLILNKRMSAKNVSGVSNISIATIAFQHEWRSAGLILRYALTDG